MTSTVLPTFYLSHGGGPWPWLEEMIPLCQELERSLLAIPPSLPGRPEAILVISGHWEENEFTVMCSAAPPMVYDYSGFPSFTYSITYSAPGSPTLARRIEKLLTTGGYAASVDSARGFDHGTYSILKPMYPAADVPVVQLSLKRGYDPKSHIEIGRLLSPLRSEGVLIIGSGLSYHNLRFPKEAKDHSASFDQWLHSCLINSDAETRIDKLMHWEDAPAARFVHPREDHLIPLMVAVGAAEKESATLIYNELFMDRFFASSFRFG